MPRWGFFSIAEDDPGRRALVDAADRVTTYGVLAEAAHRLAHGMRALGLARGDTLAAIVGNRREALELYAAGVEIGLFVVLLNWHLTADEVAYVLADSGAKVLVTEAAFADVAVAAGDAARIPASARFVLGDDQRLRPVDELVAGHPATPPVDRSSGQAMFYTSGTTGKPKGVRKKLVALTGDDVTLAAGIGLGGSAGRAPVVPPEKARVQLVSGPLYHAAPLATAAMALDEGAFVVLMDRFDAERFLALVERHRVSSASMVPTMFHRLLSLPEDVRASADVSSLVAVSHAGAPCSIDVKRRMIDWFGPILTEGYSSTEGAGTSITSAEWLERPGSVGRPAPGVELRILDDDGDACAVGVPGRVFVTQAMWEFEYLGDAEKTEASRRDGMFTVGDIGYVDDEGYLFLCDREADVIISGGVNIYPAEVEGALLAHPAVADVAVIGAPSDEWGEEVRAVVELRAGRVGDPALEAELVGFCRDRMAHFKCPRAVDFVDSLGRDPNGKLRKRPIRDRYWQGRDRRI